jgi:hypothetical protein
LKAPTLLRRLYRAISRRSYDQLSALKPLSGLVRPLWRSKELRAGRHLHDRPRWSAGLADDNQILPLIAAISWHVTEHGCGLAPTGTR